MSFPTPLILNGGCFENYSVLRTTAEHFGVGILKLVKNLSIEVRAMRTDQEGTYLLTECICHIL